jgi:hypothetical protein
VELHELDGHGRRLSARRDEAQHEAARHFARGLEELRERLVELAHAAVELVE